MTLSPSTRTILWTATGVFLAVVVGNEVANESYALPTLVAGLISALIIGKYASMPLPALLLGFGLAGNIVGNRGFAQLYLTPSLPLLPAEFILLTAGGIILVSAAFAKRLPLKLDLLNIAIASWILVSIARLPADLHTYGALALRDFASVDYAAFFFIAQEICRQEASRTFVQKCLLWSCLVLILFYPIYYEFSDYIITNLTFRGNPVLFYKGDLIGMFLSIAAVLSFAKFEGSSKKIWLVLCLIAAAEAFSLNNRASALGLIIAAVIFAAVGKWRLIATLGVGAVAAVAFYVGVATFTSQSWQETPVYAGYEELASLTDPSGSGSYSGAGTANKGDNNAFRFVWWKITIEDAVQNGPVLGLGWGYDLADSFERIYYPEGSDEFSARSPHNIVISVFARGGILSLGFFILVLTAMGWRTFKAGRERAPEFLYWVICWMIFVTACLGVVLEGPMGAVVFWTVMAIASSEPVAFGALEGDPPAVLETVPAALE